MADMRVDRQILEEHIDLEETVDTAMRLSNLKYSCSVFSRPLPVPSSDLSSVMLICNLMFS